MPDGPRLVDVTGEQATTFALPFVALPAGKGTVVARLDGDGFDDLAVADGIGHSVQILLGQGDFRVGTPLPAGTRPTSIVSGRFDGDAFEDLAVTHAQSQTLSVCLGHGDGTFTCHFVAANIAPYGIDRGDFDRDGEVDLVTADFSSPAGHGMVSFYPRRTAVGDGDLDLVVACINGKTVAVLLGDGARSFAQLPAIEPPQTPADVVLGHFDADRFLDLAVTAPNIGSS